jgi:MoxR-like ATPase
MNSKQYKTFTKTVALQIANKAFRETRSYSRPVFIFWGPAGVGKTYTIKEAGTAINFPVINVRLGQELAEDMSYPLIDNMEGSKERTLKKIVAEMWPRYKTDELGNKIPRRKNVDGEIVDIDGEYQIAFSSVKTYVENFSDIEMFYTEQGLTVDDAPGGIFFLDEINRIEDKQMFQMIFQLFESGKFKGFVLPEELSLFGACNPSKGYIVSNWFDDKAFSNRCVHMKLTFDADIALENVRKANYSELSTEFVSTYPELLFDPKDNNFDIPKLDYSMRNLSFFENYVAKMDWSKTENPEIEIELVASIYGSGAVGNYHTIVDRTAQKAIEPLEIITQYDEYALGENPYNVKMEAGLANYIADTVFQTLEDRNIENAKSKQRTIFLQAIASNRSDYIDRVQKQLNEYIIANVDSSEFKELFGKNKLRFLRFIMDLPKDTYASFMRPLMDDENYKEAEGSFLEMLDVDQDDIPTRALVDCILQLNEIVQERVLS